MSHEPNRDSASRQVPRAEPTCRAGSTDLEALEETLDVLSDPEAMRRLREGEAAVTAGDVLDEGTLRDLVSKRG